MSALAVLITVATVGLSPVQRITAVISGSKVDPAGLAVPTAPCHSAVRAIEIRTSQMDAARLWQQYQPCRTFWRIIGICTHEDMRQQITLLEMNGLICQQHLDQ